MIIGYVRVSTDEQARGKSPERQVEQLLAAGIPRDRIFVDEGYSGKTERRPAWQRILKLLDKGAVTTLCAADLSRLHRNAKDALVFLHRYVLAGPTVALKLLHEDVTLANANDKFNFTIRVAANQWHSDAASDKTKRAMEHKRSKGEYIGGRVPFGYRLSADGRTLERDEAEQRAITFMREQAAAGRGPKAIASQLRAQGVRTKLGCTLWDSKVVLRILAREVREGIGPNNVSESDEGILAGNKR